MRAGRRLFDISQTLSPDLPVWPGDTRLSVAPVWTHGEQCPVAVARLALSPHSGAHADAPLHYDPEGIAMAEVELDAYLGPARVVDLSGHVGQIEPEHLEPALAAGVRRVLLRTYSRFPHDRWVSEFATPTASAIDRLADHGVVLIGVDAPSIDPEASKTLDAHRAVARRGLHILEGLVLDDVPAGDYELIALPLKLAGVDASPVRAVLRDLA